MRESHHNHPFCTIPLFTSPRGGRRRTDYLTQKAANSEPIVGWVNGQPDIREGSAKSAVPLTRHCSDDHVGGTKCKNRHPATIKKASLRTGSICQFS